jgi:hypothetical protein
LHRIAKNSTLTESSIFVQDLPYEKDTLIKVGDYSHISKSIPKSFKAVEFGNRKLIEGRTEHFGGKSLEVSMGPLLMKQFFSLSM